MLSLPMTRPVDSDTCCCPLSANSPLVLGSWNPGKHADATFQKTFHTVEFSSWGLAHILFYSTFIKFLHFQGNQITLWLALLVTKSYNDSGFKNKVW